MSPNIAKLRSPNQLEKLFYRELLAPLDAFVATHSNDPAWIEEIKLATHRFKKEIMRYGYVLTEFGVMVRVDPDVINTRLDAARHAMLALDMQIFNRLTNKR